MRPLRHSKSSLQQGTHLAACNDVAERLMHCQRMIARYEKQTACDEYKRLQNTLSALDASIPELQQQLSQQQNDYLDRYFDEVNRRFVALGSRDFSLHRATDLRGNKPVYYLKVKFKGVDISEPDLDKAFSESDRRALGLAVFLTSLQGMESDELAATIVIFDDPVTSFDDHRVGQTHRQIVNLAEDCAQVILLSHYREGICQFIQTHTFSNDHQVKLLEISKDPQSAGFTHTELACFTRTVLEQNRESIMDFIERKVDQPACALRVYLETELANRFAGQIRQHQIDNHSLSQRIDGLAEHHVITPEVAKALHRWRNDLNPEHHICVGNDLEDKRNTANEFMTFVFEQLVPAAE